MTLARSTYRKTYENIADLLEATQLLIVSSINALMTSAYWCIGLTFWNLSKQVLFVQPMRNRGIVGGIEKICKHIFINIKGFNCFFRVRPRHQLFY